MNTLEQLLEAARERRDNAISLARENYEQEVHAIKLAARENRVVVHITSKRRKRYNTKINHNGKFSSMSCRAAAEAVLVELGPLTLTELTVEIQRRGCRPKDPPRVVAHAVRTSLLYHKGRYSRDEEGRWVNLTKKAAR